MWKEHVCNRTLKQAHSLTKMARTLLENFTLKICWVPDDIARHWWQSHFLMPGQQSPEQCFRNSDTDDLKKRADVYLLVCKLCPNAWMERIKVAQYIFKCLEGVESRLTKKCCSWEKQKSFTNPNIPQEKACLFPNGFPPLSLMLWTAVQINVR